MTTQDQTTIVDSVITARHSVRAFLDTPVDTQTIKDILTVASRAPSGANTQPWKVYVVTGDKRTQLIDNIFAAKQAIADDPSLADKFQETFPYYPTEWISPFIDRRRENGWGLYGLLGIQKGDKEKMAAQHDRNFKLFDAPVGLFFTVNKVMGIGSKMDIAMMIQNVMIAAKARGLDTCPQAAFNHFHPVVLETIGAGDDEELVCTVALGYADESDIVNTFITPRVPMDEFAVFLD
ncbi:nitroreductase [Moraxella sp. RCAD0137]|uniref:nitroreductase n=1 Tax=Moraxella sp. RCAD0137 TaxID=1775913 RepID=UPI000C9FF2F6|nr:nitroreductase [Moraxella sp. RCAD0137]PNP98653.1 nitrobenzoate reductase [Moraxella sp. RCAD0137]